MLNNLLASGLNLSQGMEPVYEVLTIVLPIVLAIVFIIGTFKCVALGIAFSKSDENGTHEKAKKDLINAIVGFGLIFILIAVLFFVRGPILEWITSITESMPMDENSMLPLFNA